MSKVLTTLSPLEIQQKESRLHHRRRKIQLAIWNFLIAFVFKIACYHLTLVILVIVLRYCGVMEIRFVLTSNPPSMDLYRESSLPEEKQ